MNGKVLIDRNKTQENLGYNIESLSSGSNKKVYCKCSLCLDEFLRPYKDIKRFHHCSIVRGNEKRCFKCQEWKHLDLFPKNKKLSGGRAKLCLECYNSYECVKKYEKKRSLDRANYLSNNDIEKYIRYRAYRLKYSSQNRNLECDLDYEFLLNLWKQQNGKCFYTGIPLNGFGRSKGWQHWDAPSIDRIDSNYGYLKNNVVWCAFGVNSFKGNLTIDEFQNIINKISWWFEKIVK